MGCNLVFDRVLPGHPSFLLLLFFLKPDRFQPQVGQVPGRPVGLGQVLKLWVKFDIKIKLKSKSKG